MEDKLKTDKDETQPSKSKQHQI